MSEAKHTPWAVEPLVHPLGWGIYEGPRRMIAEVRGNGTDDEYRVDLRTMQRGRNEDCWCDISFNPSDRRHSAACLKARAAIAKARGEA